jgi:predicted aspartyl protease
MRYRRTTLSALLALVLVIPTLTQAAEIALTKSGGIYAVPVEINRSVAAQFLVDPGSAVVVIPKSILQALVRSGTVTQDDVIGASIAELADSSLHQLVHLRLRELRVGDVVLQNVVAAVSPGLSQPLLGQSFLERFASVTFDNQRRVMVLNGLGMTAGSEYSATVRTAPAYPPAATGPSGGYGPPSYWRFGQ